VRNNQTYIPKVEEYIIGKTFRKNNNETEENLLESIVKGINLIGLQTLYPNILILIVMFLSLLISSFISLNEINSTATQRHNLIRGIFFPEIISVYFSSLIVISIPLICIVLLGQYLFRLQIFQNALYISMILLLLISIFILLGMALSYLIKKESITLLISTFILVFLVFFSGFMLPIERMSNTANIVASNSPSTISLSAFNRIIFYSQGFEVIAPNVYQLIIWFGTLLLLTTLIKSMKK
ncbi:MAG: ABC transporter permease, partial [Candidatus Woesearchaeota archaeon]